MPFDANGNFSLVPGTIVADGMNVLPSQHNPPFQDVANGLSQVVVRDGRAPMTGPLNMNGNKITGVASGDAPTDVVTNADIADLAVSIGDGAWSVRDLSPNWLRRDGSLYDSSDYPVLAGLLPALPDGVGWTSLPTSITGSIKEIIPTDDGFMLISDGGTDSNIYTSATGRDWSLVATIPSFRAEGLTTGAGIYVAVDGNGKVSVSNDGISWGAPSSSGATGLRSVAYGAGKFVALGTGGSIYSSVDGASWDLEASGTSESLWRVRFLNPDFVVVGANGTILSSPDGETWTSRTSGVSSTLRDVAFGSGVYVVTGNSGTIITSSNLTTWTARSSGTTLQLMAAIYSTSGFMVVGYSGVARISSNGTTWTATATGVSTNLVSLTFNPDRQQDYYAVGGASVLEGVRTLPTQFRVPNDDPTYGWIRAL